MSFSAMMILGRTCLMTAVHMKKIFGGPAKLWPVQVLPAVCGRVDYTALFAVIDAPGCQKHVFVCGTR